jgi:hypothetical protein
MARKVLLVVRWSARITSLMLVALVLVFMVGEGPPNPFKQPSSVQVEFLGMALMLAGFLLGWRWEAMGGIMAVVGFAAFFATELVVNGRPPGGAIPLFVVPGVLFLVSYGLAAMGRRLPAVW